MSIIRPVPPITERFVHAPELQAWLEATFIDEGGVLHNPDHSHLLGADLACLWAPSDMTKAGKTVVGMTEELFIREGGWKRDRTEQFYRDIFDGRVPRFVMTLSAPHCTLLDDMSFCALVEHELYHIGQKADLFGFPAYDSMGNPKLQIVSHDVEEFVGVVRRYGISNPDGAIGQLTAAVRNGPQIDRAVVYSCCGTCNAKI